MTSASPGRTRAFPARSSFHPYTPLWVAVSWLGGTYVAFLLLGQVSRAPDLWLLSLFVGATLLALTIGYRLESGRSVEVVVREVDLPRVRRVTLCSGAYLGAYGVALLLTFGVSGPAEIVNALVNPGQAYLSKVRHLYSPTRRRIKRRYSGPHAACCALCALGALRSPLLGSGLTPAIRFVAILGVGLYASFYLYIGYPQRSRRLADLSCSRSDGPSCTEPWQGAASSG